MPDEPKPEPMLMITPGPATRAMLDWAKMIIESQADWPFDESIYASKILAAFIAEWAPVHNHVK